MKLLHVTDLHGNSAWYQWLLSNCAGTTYDAIFLTGDLINLMGNRFKKETVEVEKWAADLRATGAPLFICSGNHDMWYASGSWSWIKAQHGTVFLPGLTVTSVPWLLQPWSEAEKIREFDALQRSVRKVPQPWCVLEHSPPFATKVAGRASPHPDDVQLSLLPWEPDFIFSGHIHYPHELGGDWTDTITGPTQRTTHLFNAGGGNRKSPFPNKIVMDLVNRTATWTRYDEKTALEKVRVKEL